MDVLRMRGELRQGRSIFDLPLRVTFYARVSTDKDEQRNSLGNQVQYYTALIQSKPNWTYIEGYVDEGISGTSTRKRDSFNRMIADAQAGRFDFIITKEISRFSRSTLDSILYTQRLLECGVGVLFQNDNINTLDPDSEFRLVVMAGVAQDEVRKLSDRLKFGFRQAVKNGHVLGSDNLWGYRKKGCVLTVNEEEAQAVRRIFDLYANGGLGVRRISRILTAEGFTSRRGNDFNSLTVRHILQNPKYKGWYCGGKSQSLDYRTKKKASLDESQWVMYPDPAIPAIVSEALWDRANALYRERGRQAAARRRGTGFHSRYPYSGKIICGAHQTSFHRQVLRSGRGEREVWQCREYRNKGRAGCAAPQLRTEEINQVMVRIFRQAVDGNAAIEAVTTVLRAVPGRRDCRREVQGLEEEMAAIAGKKDRLLELSVDGALSAEEFRERNEGFNRRLAALEKRREALRSEETPLTPEGLEAVREALERMLSLRDGIDAGLAAAILDHIVVREGSTRERISLDVRLKWGEVWEAELERRKSSFVGIRLKNITPPT